MVTRRFFKESLALSHPATAVVTVAISFTSSLVAGHPLDQGVNLRGLTGPSGWSDPFCGRMPAPPWTSLFRKRASWEPGVGFITDRDGELLELEADHRRHAEIENAIRDLKYGVGLNHLPSGRFAANGAWLAVQTMAHNLARWTARIGLGERIATTKTLRRRFFSLAGWLTRSARRLTLHLPDRWPWAEKFSRALARLRAIPLPA